jgi:hypothetical protein
LNPDWKVVDRNQVHALGLRAINGEVVDLAQVRAARRLRISVMSVRAADGKSDSSVTKPPCLALDSGKRVAVVDDKVIAGVLSERHENCEARHPKSEHDGERGLITDILRMNALHVAMLGNRPDAATIV